jgi:hypothetical protein
VFIQSIVARIAYLSSDVIISVQSAQAVESKFSTHLHRYSGRKDSGLVATSEGGVPEVRFFGNSVNIHMLSTNRYQDIKY